ncbi:o-succinylbenzoate synthase [Salinithrix halophila]|uniref:o-succinylbenzoate synthase n=1 Tax=Salinithrix halophila TaxID=1485204 RepID=A0ABV8JBR0_9BACL
MGLKTPFSNSLTTLRSRDLILVEVWDQDGRTGWGECVAFSSPWYTEETVGTAWHVMESFLVPRLLGETIDHPEEIRERFAAIRRNPMAKAALEGAVWDLWCKESDRSLSQSLGGTRERVEAGVAVGVQGSPAEMIDQVRRRVEEGYRRIKVKIRPGADIEVIAPIREAFPDLPLMADANSAYTLEDLDYLRRLDEFRLLMVEQPLDADDLVDHARLQERMETAICLDESITSFDDARRAADLGSCQVINVKPGRVGGLAEAKRIHDLCVERGIRLWCGGMLESGISRAHNLALASLPGFTLPGDLSASSRHWDRDVIIPEATVDQGWIHVPRDPGIGVKVDRERIAEVRVQSRRFPG